VKHLNVYSVSHAGTEPLTLTLEAGATTTPPQTLAKGESWKVRKAFAFEDECTLTLTSGSDKANFTWKDATPHTSAGVALGLALSAVPSVGCFKSGPVGRVNILEGRTKDTRGTYLGLPLKSGQVVLTESPDTTSFAFSLIPEKFFPFTHVAILSMEDGEPWVYDVTGGVATIPTHSRMLDNVSGTLFRRPLMEYASGNMHTEIYEPGLYFLTPGAERMHLFPADLQVLELGAP